MELPRAAKLIRMLSSPSDSEVLSAARALCRMGIHDVAERVENGPKYETAIRYARPRQTREIARLSRLVEELQSQVARFAFRSCLVCGEPFRAGRADASTCSARCQESRAQRDISASKQRPTQSRSVGPLISDVSVPTGVFPTDRRLTVRRAAWEKAKPAVCHGQRNSR